MANADTVKAIEDNLTAILVAQGFKVEDLSADPDADVTPLATILFDGEDFEDNYGEKPKYNDAKFTIAIRFSDKAPATARERVIGYSHLLRDNITVVALNVGGLVSSKLVSRVTHEGYQHEYRTPISQTAYSLAVRYREL